jgi:hypothetical protein
MNRAEAEKMEEHYRPSLEVVKVMVKDYFEQHHGEVIDYVDLVNTFNLSLPLIVEACEELEREGKIAGVD